MAGLDPAIFVSAAAAGRMRALERGRGDLQILDEELILPRLGVGIRKPEQVGRMHRDHRLGCDHVGTLGQVDDVAAVLGDWRDLAEHRLRRGRAQRHHQGRADRSELTLVPLPAGLDLRRRRLLVQPDLAAGDELEVLHRIGDVDLAAVDAGLLQRPVEHLAGRADEGMAGEVLLVAGLLADQHQRRMVRAFAEHGLRGILPQRAGAAGSGFFTQGLKIGCGDIR